MPVVANAHDLEEDPSPLGFVLADGFLITIRYAQLRSFENVAEQFSKPEQPFSSSDIFSTLVEEMVDVSADLLEKIASELDGVSKLVFKKTNLKRRHPSRSNDRLHKMLVDVGNVGERLSRVRDSLLRTPAHCTIRLEAEARLDWPRTANTTGERKGICCR